MVRKSRMNMETRSMASTKVFPPIFILLERLNDGWMSRKSYMHIAFSEASAP